MSNTSYPTVNISLKRLIQECAKDPNQQQDMFYDFSMMSREHIHEIFKYKKFNYDFTDFLTVYNDGTSPIGFIRASYDEFLSSLMKFLGVEGNYKDDEILTYELESRIRRLRQISSEGELRQEFPYLYDDLVNGRKFIEEIRNLKRLDAPNTDAYEEQEHYYYGCALKHRLDRFIETQSELYSRFVHQRKEYKELIESKSYNGYIREKMDVNKMALYIAWEYIMVCEQTCDAETLQRYLDLVDQYFRSSYDKSVSIHIDRMTVTYYLLVAKYNEMKHKLDKESRTFEWEIVPKGKLPRRVKRGLTENPHQEVFSTEEIERLKAKGREKEEFYQNSDYVFKAEGRTQYEGYVGYMYPNGKVLLDRKFEETSARSAENNAIYIIQIDDFERLSKLDKATLQKQPEVKRMFHNYTWRERARRIIEEEVSEEEKQKVKSIMEDLRKKSR